MSGVSADIWGRLEGGLPRGEALLVRLAAPEVSDQLLAAIDSNGRRRFLISVNDEARRVVDRQSRGIHANTRELSIPGHAPGWYIDVVCTDPAGHEAFQLVGNELASRLGHGADAAEVVRRVLAKWRRFWGELPRELLSRNEQIGLFAELWFLQYWLIPIVGANEAVVRWRGPMHGRHDFEWSKGSVEVKGTTAAHAPVHRISGIDQLSPPAAGELFLFSLQLREEGGATNTLPAMVETCLRSMAADEEVLSRFEALLASARYSTARSEEYAGFRLRVVEEALFTVREDFPRITREQFVDGVPAGVESIEYEINVSAFERLKVSREAWEHSESI